MSEDALSPVQRRPQVPARLRAWLMGRDRGALAILALFVLLLPISLPRIYATDEVQYYAYLRSFYFDGDLDFRNEYEHFAQLGEQQNPPDPAVRNALLREDALNPNPRTGKLRNVAPIGSAILWSPGFVLADAGVLLARALGSSVARDGYSRPYIWAVCFMSALYALGGLLLSYRLARRYAGPFAAALATVGVWLASPLLMYTYILMPWSHPAGFFLFALVLTLWLAIRDRAATGAPTLRLWALLGLAAGLMTITREQLGLLLLIPAVDAIINYVELFRRREWTAARALVLRHTVFLALFVLALVPQLLVYQVLNGRPAPSATVGGKLVWCSPHFLDTLVDFDPRPSPFCPLPGDISANFPPFAHGAFLWAPILVPGLLGLVLLARRDRRLALLLLLGFVAQTYINGAFGTTWHLTRSFGFRRLIECTPIFVLGLAALIEWWGARGRRALPVALVAFLIYWNIALIAQWTFVRPELRNGLVWDGMLHAQFVEVPGRVVGKLDDVLFHRCRLASNKTC
jgi:hypothetical protein